MAEPTRSSALDKLAVVGRSLAGPRPVTLAALPFRGKLILRGTAEATTRAVTALGFLLPESLRRSHRDGTDALWLGPDEWLVLLPQGKAAEEIAGRLGEALAGSHHALTEVGDRFTGISVEGPAVQEVLAAGCPIDLHPRSFAPGTVVRTLLAKAPVILCRPEERDRFELHVNGSLAPYVWLFLENAAREFGFTISA